MRALLLHPEFIPPLSNTTKLGNTPDPLCFYLLPKVTPTMSLFNLGPSTVSSPAPLKTSSRALVPAPSRYPPPPRASLIRRAVAYVRERSIKRQSNPTRPSVQAGSFSSACTSATSGQSSSDVTHPSIPQTTDQTSPLDAYNDDGLRTFTQSLSLAPVNALQSPLTDDGADVDRSLFAFEAIQAFLSGYCGPDLVQSPPVDVKCPQCIVLIGPTPEPTTEVVTEGMAPDTKGARFLQRLNTWIEGTRGTHVDKPSIDERPLPGHDFVMNWATIPEE